MIQHAGVRSPSAYSASFYSDGVSLESALIHIHQEPDRRNPEDPLPPVLLWLLSRWRAAGHRSLQRLQLVDRPVGPVHCREARHASVGSILGMTRVGFEAHAHPVTKQHPCVVSFNLWWRSSKTCPVLTIPVYIWCAVWEHVPESHTTCPNL